MKNPYPLKTIAELLDITPQWVLQLVKKGVIPEGQAGKYDLVPTVHGYIDYLKDLAKGKDNSKAKHEKDKVENEAKLKKLAVERLEGILVNADDVKKEAFESGRKIRDAMMNIPDRLAPLLSAETDENAVHKALDGEIREILEGAKDE